MSYFYKMRNIVIYDVDITVVFFYIVAYKVNYLGK